MTIERCVCVCFEGNRFSFLPELFSKLVNNKKNSINLKWAMKQLICGHFIPSVHHHHHHKQTNTNFQ